MNAEPEPQGDRELQPLLTILARIARRAAASAPQPRVHLVPPPDKPLGAPSSSSCADEPEATP
jgi:hypothetical protein